MFCNNFTCLTILPCTLSIFAFPRGFLLAVWIRRIQPKFSSEVCINHRKKFSKIHLNGKLFSGLFKKIWNSKSYNDTVIVTIQQIYLFYRETVKRNIPGVIFENLRSNCLVIHFMRKSSVSCAFKDVTYRAPTCMRGDAHMVN